MQKHVNHLDLAKSFPTNIFLQNLASIQKRTSPIKFAHLAEKSENGSISNLSTQAATATAATTAIAATAAAVGATATVHAWTATETAVPGTRTTTAATAAWLTAILGLTQLSNI